MKTASASVMAMIISVAVLMVMILLCVMLFYIHKKNSAKIFLLGMLGYFIPQVVIRYPMLSYMPMEMFSAMDGYALIGLLSLSAALLETIGRYVILRFLSKREQDKAAGIIAGLGHGICEAIFLLGIMYLHNLFIVYLAQQGTDSTQIRLVTSAIEQTPMHMFYFVLLERSLYIVIQVGLSVCMMQGILKKKKRTLIVIFLLHAALDVAVTLCSYHGVSALYLDILIFVAAGISAVYVWKVRYPKQEDETSTVEKEETKEVLKG